MNKNVNAINDRFVNSFSAFMEESMKYDENNLRTYLQTRMNYFLILHNVGQAVLKGEKVELKQEELNQLKDALQLLAVCGNEMAMELRTL